MFSGRKKRSLSEFDSTENQMDYVEDEELEENNPEANVREELDDIWRHNWLRRVANQLTRNNRKVKLWTGFVSESPFLLSLSRPLTLKLIIWKVN